MASALIPEAMTACDMPDFWEATRTIAETAASGDLFVSPDSTKVFNTCVDPETMFSDVFLFTAAIVLTRRLLLFLGDLDDVLFILTSSIDKSKKCLNHPVCAEPDGDVLR